MGLKPMVIFVWEEGGGHPSQGLPLPGFPVDPGYGVGTPMPPHPSQGLPVQPGHPSQGLPHQPGHPDQSLPPIPVLPDQSLPTGDGTPRPAHPATLPALPQGAFVIAWVPGHGYVAISVTPPARPDQSLPPGAATKPTPPQPTPTPQGRR